MTMIKVQNLLAGLPESVSEEVFETLAQSRAVKIERIVSRGQTTRAGEWYDQAGREWVMVVKGRASLLFETGERVEMGPGDYLDIPAHARHRVEWTDPAEETVWLAVHYPANV